MGQIVEYFFDDLLKSCASVLLLTIAYKIYRVKLHIEGTSPCCKFTSDNPGGQDIEIETPIP